MGECEGRVWELGFNSSETSSEEVPWKWLWILWCDYWECDESEKSSSCVWSELIVEETLWWIGSERRVYS